MKQFYVWIVAILISATSFSQAVVEMDPQLPINDPAGIIGFANVFETPANGGGFVFGSPWGVADLNTDVDPVENTITLLPNYFIYSTVPQTDLFWFTPSGGPNKVFSASTYVQDNSLVGQPFTFTGGVSEYTLDPAYDVVAFIRVFDAGFGLLTEVTQPLVEGENFAVVFDNVQAGDANIQYGFQVTGLIADPANAATLGSVVIESSINDECADAIALECGDTVFGDTTNDTDSGGNAAPDEWYSFTGTGNPQIVTASLCDVGTNFDTVIRVFDACGGTEIGFDDDGCGPIGGPSEVTFFSDGTSTYFIMVEGFGSASGSFNLSISCESPEANDLCDDAIAISCGSVTAGSTLLATIDDAIAPACSNNGGGPDPVEVTAPGVWYIYEDTTGLVTDITLSTCDDADFDTKISVYTGDCTDLTCFAAVDDTTGCAGFTGSVDFQSDGNTTFYILVHGFGTQTGNFNLTMDCTIVPPDNDLIANAIDLDETGCPFTDVGVQMPGATAEAANPTDCDISGANGVWYKFTPVSPGFITATILNPSPFSSVTFYTAPDENATETDLVLVDWFENQCVPGSSARIPYMADQAYYCFVANEGAVTDIEFSECDSLGLGDNLIEGFVMYPNPTNSVVNISANEMIDTLAVFNVLGQQVMQVNVNATTAQLNVSSLAAGAYIVKASVNGQTGTYQLMKN